MEASTLIDPRVVDAVTAVVPVVAHGPLEHGTYDSSENGRVVQRCRLYRNLECSEHQATHDALKPYQPAGRFRIPFTVWIAPDGKQLFRRDGWRRPDEFLFDIRLGLEKVAGPHLSKSEYLSLVKPLDEGTAALAAQRYAEAAARFEEAARPDVPEIRAAAEAGLKEITTLGDSIVAAAKSALKAGRTVQARPALDMAARQFPSLESGRQALKLISELPFPLKELTLREIGEGGGRAIYLKGDGTGVVQVVTKGGSGLRERRFAFEARDAATWADLPKLAAENSGGPISLSFWTGHKSRSDAAGLRAWLVSRAETAEKGMPRWEGAHDPAWRPWESEK